MTGWDSAFEDQYDTLRAYAARKARDPIMAQDLVHEAYLKLAGQPAKQVLNPKAFMFRVIKNLLADNVRREKTRGARQDEVGFTTMQSSAAVDPERQLAGRQELSRLLAAVDELPPRCRECFILRRFDELTTEEIALRMGISRNMVEKHLRFALAHFSRQLPYRD